MATWNASGATDGAERRQNLSVEVASKDALDIRSFSVKEQICSLFEVELLALAESADLDFDAIVGHPARFSMATGGAERAWSGLVSHLEQVGSEERGLSTYRLLLVPSLWLLTQRRNYRIFQQISEPEAALTVLGEWGINPAVKLDMGAYKKRKYRVQYAESDYAFVRRMLEDAGISFYFEDGGGESRLVLSDVPHLNEPRASSIRFHDNPAPGDRAEHVTRVSIAKRVRPGRYTLRDHDYRLAPQYNLAASAADGGGVEEKLERYHYTPGAFLFGADKGEPTPSADDKGRTRTDEGQAAMLAQRRLEAKRGSAKQIALETNAHDLAPGVVFRIEGHPRADLGEDRRLLIVASTLSGTFGGEWSHKCEARSAETPYRPPLATPKPRVLGVESATVVGPPGEEIHTDEFGRVRCHFHWDRESRMDDNSSCWIHVSQPWGGAGYGGVSLPRVGQEVLVDFLGGDPDRPVIVGRVYTNLQKVPYGLPANKTRSGWKSNSTGGTGGYNEIMFEDAAGRELLNIQAERDLNKLVKHDEAVTIGNDRTKSVGRDDALTVGKNRTKTVGGSERSVVGVNQSVSVGVNRATQVGRIDSTIVGETHVVMVMPPGENGDVTCTCNRIEHDFIELRTPSGASIVLDKDEIKMEAAYIRLKSSGEIVLEAGDKATVWSRNLDGQTSFEGVRLQADNGSIVIQGGPMVKVNPP